MNERFDNLKDRVNGVRQDVLGIRDRDIPKFATQESLTRIESKVDKLPTMKEIVEELVDSKSPLATKSQLHQIEKDLSKDLAWVKSGLAFNLVGIFAVLLTIWLNTPKIQAGSVTPPTPSPSPTSNR